MDYKIKVSDKNKKSEDKYMIKIEHWEDEIDLQDFS